MHNPVNHITTTVDNRKHRMPCIKTKGERRDSKINAVRHSACRHYSCGNPKKRETILKDILSLIREQKHDNRKAVKRPLY